MRGRLEVTLGQCSSAGRKAENQDFHRPAVIDHNRHLKLGLNDIAEARPGLTEPGEAHVDRLIRFAQGWDQRAPLVIHCWLGISRSPAAALITALTLEPDQDEMALAEALQRLLENPTLRAELGRRGRQKVIQEFNIDRNAERLASIFERYVQHPAKPSVSHK